MNSARYGSYKRALALIDGIDGDDGDAPGRLRELAQDMLLTRGDEPDRGLVDDCAELISSLLSAGTMSAAVADELWMRLCDCGPPAGEPAPVSA